VEGKVRKGDAIEFGSELKLLALAMEDLTCSADGRQAAQTRIEGEVGEPQRGPVILWKKNKCGGR